MKKLLVLATAAAVLLIAPAAEASTSCDGATSVATRGGYTVKFDRYRALAPYEASEVTRRMNCASVRYAARAVQAKVRIQRGYPRLPKVFFDGYVSWDCYSVGRDVECVEYDSNTGFRFRGRVS